MSSKKWNENGNGTTYNDTVSNDYVHETTLTDLFDMYEQSIPERVKYDNEQRATTQRVPKVARVYNHADVTNTLISSAIGSLVARINGDNDTIITHNVSATIATDTLARIKALCDASGMRQRELVSLLLTSAVHDAYDGIKHSYKY